MQSLMRIAFALCSLLSCLASGPDAGTKCSAGSRLPEEVPSSIKRKKLVQLKQNAHVTPPTQSAVETSQMPTVIDTDIAQAFLQEMEFPLHLIHRIFENFDADKS